MLKDGLDQLFIVAGAVQRAKLAGDFVYKQAVKCRTGDRICREGAKRIARGSSK